jgi:hypothetical protein
LPLGHDPLEVHSLVCARDVPMSLWSLRSFVARSGVRPHIVVHDDGTLSQEHRELYARHFDGIRVLDEATTSARMDELLAPWPTCRRYRRSPNFYCARKLFDPVFLSQADAVLLIDSDILFFSRPTELLGHVHDGRACFGSDYQDAYASPLAELNDWRREPVLPRVNAGLLHIPVGAYRARMDLVEAYLVHAAVAWPSAPVNRHEQTAHALLMSALGSARLPPTYAIEGPIDARTVSFHFVDDGTNRMRFWQEGVPAIQ